MLKKVKGNKPKKKSAQQEHLDRILIESGEVPNFMLYRIKEGQLKEEPLLLVPAHDVHKKMQEVYIAYKRAGYRGKKVTSGEGNHNTVFIAMRRKNIDELIIVYAYLPKKGMIPKYNSVNELEDDIEPFNFIRKG